MSKKLSYAVLKDCLLLWLEETEREEPIQCRISPGMICNNLRYSIENSIYQIEQIPREEWPNHPISKARKLNLTLIYHAIQNENNFDLTEYGYKTNWTSQ